MDLSKSGKENGVDLRGMSNADENLEEGEEEEEEFYFYNLIIRTPYCS